MQRLEKDDVICRVITEAVISQVVDCLERGFPHRPRNYWVAALGRMSKLPTIEEYPRYGYALEARGQVVGVLLTIYSRREGVDCNYVCCNLSSWCVDSEYRGAALILHMAAVKRKEVTYLNISPAQHTQATIEALGFRRFTNGQIFCAPILSHQHNARVRAFAPNSPESDLLPKSECKILTEHASFGNVSLVCVKDGTAYPFVFQYRKVMQHIRCSHLIYCRRMDDFFRFAGPLGRYLLLRSGPFCIVDTTGPVDGLFGRYFAERNPKYFKGPAPPRLGDLSYTELAVFGS